MVCSHSLVTFSHPASNDVLFYTIIFRAISSFERGLAMTTLSILHFHAPLGISACALCMLHSTRAPQPESAAIRNQPQRVINAYIVPLQLDLITPSGDLGRIGFTGTAFPPVNLRAEFWRYARRCASGAVGIAGAWLSAGSVKWGSSRGRECCLASPASCGIGEPSQFTIVRLGPV